MRLGLALVALGLTLGACTDNGGATDATDGVVDTNDDGNNSAERLGVPEEFKFLWNTEDGCETADGGDGVQLYWHTSDAESFEQGGRYFLRATETWYWFHGGTGSADCKDTWEITAEFIQSDYARYGCAQCEEAYYFTRTLKDQGCQYGYHQLYGYSENEEPPAEPEYSGYILFDTHNTFNGAPNEDNKMLVVARFLTPSSASLNNNYGLPGSSRRDAEDATVQGPPGKYTWVGESCVGMSGGGGGA